MINSLSFLDVIFSVTIFSLLCWRMMTFLSHFFSSTISQLVTLATLLHPLSLDAFFVSTSIGSGISFLFCLEGFICFQKKKDLSGLFFFTLAAVTNINYFLIPIYFYIKNFKKFKSLLPFFVLFVALFLIYLLNLFNFESVNIFTFLVSTIQLIVAPYPVNFSPHTFVSSLSGNLVFIFFIILFFYFFKMKKFSIDFIVCLIVPTWGINFFSWSSGPKMWGNEIYFPSNFLLVTFSFIFMLAQAIPKKIFYIYFIFIFLFSVFWTLHFFPFSRALLATIQNASYEDKSEAVSLNRFLAKQYLMEGNRLEAKNLLFQLSAKHPERIDIKMDLEIFKESKTNSY